MLIKYGHNITKLGLIFVPLCVKEIFIMTYLYKSLILLLICFTLTSSIQSQDSQPLATVKIGDRQYHLHHVQSGETVFRIAQFYKVGVQDILQSNPWGPDSILMTGQVLKVPVQPLPIKGVAPADLKPAGSSHYVVVQPGQTLFGIARDNGLTVAQLQAYNKLDSLHIRIGDILYLQPPAPVSSQPVAAAPQKPKEDMPLVEKPLSVAIQQDISSKAVGTPGADMALAEQFRASQQVNSQLLTQRGSAGTLTTSNASMRSSFYCLHRHAPIGTVVRIQSLVTNKSTFVKVLGKLPDTEENKPFMLRISEAAAAELGITMEKTFVESSYYE